MTSWKRQARSGARIAGIAAGVIAVSVLGGACGAEKAGEVSETGDGSPKASPSPAPVNRDNWPAATVTSGLAEGESLPVEPYLQTYPEIVSLQQGINTATSRCMAQFGFDYPTATPGANPPDEYNAANIKRRYGLSDLAEAKLNGYQIEEDDQEFVESPLENADAEMVYDLTMVDGGVARSTYNGEPIPNGGCAGEAQRIIGVYDDSLAEELNAQSWEAAKQDPRVVAATQKWAACMTSRGHQVNTPYEALDLATSQSLSRDREITMAVADIECKQSTSLIDTYISVETALQRDLISKNSGPLDKARMRNQTVLDTARAYIN